MFDYNPNKFNPNQGGGIGTGFGKIEFGKALHTLLVWGTGIYFFALKGGGLLAFIGAVFAGAFWPLYWVIELVIWMFTN